MNATESTERRPEDYETTAMTPAKLRSYPGLDQLTDEKAIEVATTLRQVAVIFFDTHCFSDPTCIDNQQVVYSPEQKRAA